MYPLTPHARTQSYNSAQTAGCTRLSAVARTSWRRVYCAFCSRHAIAWTPTRQQTVNKRRRRKVEGRAKNSDAPV